MTENIPNRTVMLLHGVVVFSRRNVRAAQRPDSCPCNLVQHTNDADQEALYDSLISDQIFQTSPQTDASSPRCQKPSLWTLEMRNREQ